MARSYLGLDHAEIFIVSAVPTMPNPMSVGSSDGPWVSPGTAGTRSAAVNTATDNAATNTPTSLSLRYMAHRLSRLLAHKSERGGEVSFLRGHRCSERRLI